MPIQLPHDPIPSEPPARLPKQPDYVTDPAVEALTPTRPETLDALLGEEPDSPAALTPATISKVADPTLADVVRSITPTGAPPISTPRPPGSVRADGMGGMVITPDPVIDESRLAALQEPFTPALAQRQSSRDLFMDEIQNAGKPDSGLLRQFVTPGRLRELWNQIELLQEEVIQAVRSDRASTDTYQQDLLYASSLLLQTPANYDDARQIYYRVRADIYRERKVAEDSKGYLFPLLGYHLLWLAIVIVASTFDQQFRDMLPDGLPILKLSLPPILFGVLGAISNGIMALITHTSIKRDFDPIHLSWYLINPILGGLLGMVTFIFFVVAGSSFLPNLATDPDAAIIKQGQAPMVIWLLAFVIGWQQNLIFRALNRFFSSVTNADNKETALKNRPESPATPTTVTPAQPPKPPAPTG